MRKTLKNASSALLALLIAAGTTSPVFAEDGDSSEAVFTIDEDTAETGTEATDSSEESSNSEKPNGGYELLPDYENVPDLTGIDTASITIRYFDDSDETVPGTGAEYTIYQVGTIGRDVETNGRFLPLGEEVDWEGESDPVEYEAKVVAAYEENEEIGYMESGEIGEDGTLVFTDVPVGVYLVAETETLRYHIKPIPFLVSAPETNASGTSWTLDVVANPKQILAGDLKLEKEVKGSLSEKDNTYNFVVEFDCEGEYKAVLSTGVEEYVSSGDTISLKAKQSAIIQDLPAGVSYKVTEKEADMSCDTTYTNNEGEIEAKEETTVTVLNDSTQFDMGVSNTPTFWIFGGIGALTILILFILFLCKRSKKEKKEQLAETELPSEESKKES